jgi:drug/metabolite transporter (DMT)-like permease
MALIAAIPFLSGLHLSARGVLLAIISGAVTSGIGYSVWYAALKYHTATRAAVLQLSVPLITAVAGALLLAEKANLRLGLAAALILGGIAIVIASRRQKHDR